METELKLPSEWPEDFTYTDEGGLTPEQAAERMSAGRGNVMDCDQGKSLKKILFDNIFTFFNFLNFICMTITNSNFICNRTIGIKMYLKSCITI